MPIQALELAQRFMLEGKPTHAKNIVSKDVAYLRPIAQASSTNTTPELLERIRSSEIEHLEWVKEEFRRTEEHFENVESDFEAPEWE